jgi:hypothetical protein
MGQNIERQRLLCRLIDVRFCYRFAALLACSSFKKMTGRWSPSVIAKNVIVSSL